MTVTPPPVGAYPYQAWLDRSYVPLPAIDVEVVESVEGCPPGSAGCTDGAERISIALGLPYPVARHVFMHEVGHVYAVSIGHDLYDERFAEDFAFCSTHRRRSLRWYSGWRHFRRVCPALWPAPTVSVTVGVAPSR